MIELLIVTNVGFILAVLLERIFRKEHDVDAIKSQLQVIQNYSKAIDETTYKLNKHLGVK